MEYNLKDLINKDELQDLCESFASFSGIGCAILDLNRELLVSVSWKSICSEFHRKNKLSEARCNESDTFLSKLPETNQKYKLYTCKNGLIDVAVPIIIENKHVGNFFTGQFFIEKPDVNYFIKQAKEFGFDENEYLKALEEVKVFDVEYIEKIMDFLVKLTQMIAKMGLVKIKLIEKQEKTNDNVEMFKAVSRNSHNAICIINENAKIVWTNESLVRLSGYSLTRLMEAKDFTEFVAPESIEILMNDFLKFKSNQEYIQHEEFYFLRADGEKRLCEKHISDYIDSNGKRSLAVSMTDITDIRSSETTLMESEKKFRTLSETSSAGVFIHNGEKFEYVNQTVIEETGFSLEDLSTMLFIDLIYPDDREMVIDYWSRRRLGEKLPGFYECRMCKKDGGYIWANVSAKLISLNGKPCLIGTAFDITQIKFAEEQLIVAKEKAEESDRLKSSFLQNLSHEIRTPMNAIMGFSEFINDDSIDSSLRRNYSKIITESCQQLLSIVTDVLTISSIDTGIETIKKETVNVTNTLNDLFIIFNNQATKKNISLRLDKKLQINTYVNTDESKLKQIFANLIGNAIKFTHNGFVEFGYNIKGDFIVFFVKDTGIGIDASLHNKVFERFRQADLTISRKYGGTGLGLSISKALVELLGGSISIESEPLKGTTFHFTLPYNSNIKVENEKKCIEILPELAGKNILIAEDEDLNFLLLKKMLNLSNFNIFRANSGIEAIDIFNKQDIDLILMDIRMPEMNGYDATKKIKSINSTIPIIVQSAYSLQSEIQKAMDIGADDYIVKPIEKNILFKLINKYLKN
ncbi:MAG: PocR ligand-binding domain-containing protein [Bacteroidota bacterium]